MGVIKRGRRAIVQNRMFLEDTAAPPLCIMVNEPAGKNRNDAVSFETAEVNVNFFRVPSLGITIPFFMVNTASAW